MDWSSAYVAAQQMVEQKVGRLVVPMDERRLINTWVRMSLTINGKPDPAAIYFATYDQLPPASFGQPANILEAIKASRRVQGKAAPSAQEEEQITLLSAATGMLCSTATKSGALSTSVPKSGCATVLVACAVLTASTYAVLRFLS